MTYCTLVVNTHTLDNIVPISSRQGNKVANHKGRGPVVYSYIHNYISVLPQTTLTYMTIESLNHKLIVKVRSLSLSQVSTLPYSVLSTFHPIICVLLYGQPHLSSYKTPETNTTPAAYISIIHLRIHRIYIVIVIIHPAINLYGPVCVSVCYVTYDAVVHHHLSRDSLHFCSQRSCQIRNIYTFSSFSNPVRFLSFGGTTSDSSFLISLSLILHYTRSTSLSLPSNFLRHSAFTKYSHVSTPNNRSNNNTIPYLLDLAA